MGQVIRFSEFENYYKKLITNRKNVEGVILDANVLITLSYSPKKFHTRIYNFLRDKIEKNNIACYTTVNTTQEFLEFHRRLLLTDGLRTAVHASSKIKLTNKKRAVIHAQSSKLAVREKNNAADPVFYDREIKIIRNIFCNSGKAGFELWQGLCDIYLSKQLSDEFKNLNDLNIEYISHHKKEMEQFFNKDISWKGAIDICSDVGIGFTDSMILNALQCTSFPLVISLDSDLAFAVIANKNLKDVVMPDELIDKNENLRNLLS